MQSYIITNFSMGQTRWCIEVLNLSKALNFINTGPKHQNLLTIWACSLNTLNENIWSNK